MQFELTVTGEILADLFSLDYLDNEKQNRKQRLNRHVLLVNKQLIEQWEGVMQQKNSHDAFIHWLPQALASQQTIKMVSQQEEHEANTLVSVATCTKYPLIVGDFESTFVRNHPMIRFCSKKVLSEAKKATISLEMVKEIEKSGGTVQHWFSLFETTLSLVVRENQSANLLANYLSYFYDNEVMIIQDRYFVANEGNFDQYILPNIPQGCSLEIIIPTDDGANHKRRIEKKYNAKVTCYKAETMHQGFIRTKHFKITLGYRLNIFGSNGNTNREDITIIRL